VGHFHDGHTAAPVIEHFVPDLFQNRNGHGGGAGGEIIAAVIHRGVPPLVFMVILYKKCEKMQLLFGEC
jgi:hypothetical protein